ncbi:hypothetical protein Dsin_030335 [Dipteronia sinensis]|uniref:Endonuclease/exonuclease/phosphatase domain-containing protein n=1 Tax=Dipteronia sinensis TaxID=43782 RepID=A0AAE0DR66_9ROSI|nr:hypothetical protein Dsin_030335 [Dipteronia sinensis]
MLALTWNVRGLGKAEKRRKVRNVVISLKPTVFFRQESKLGVFESRTIRSLGGILLTRGDFNTVLSALERKCGDFNNWSARAFNNFILKAKMMDIPLRGVNYTWSNNKENGTWARLDRFLVSPILLIWFLNMEQTGLPRTISDHSTLTLGSSKDYWGPRPFKFNNEWLEDK